MLKLAHTGRQRFVTKASRTHNLARQMVRRAVVMSNTSNPNPAPPVAHEPPMPVINLVRGHPNPSLLPASLLAESTTAVLSDPETATPTLLYGLDPGYGPLLDQVSKWCSDFYGPTTSQLLARYADSQPTSTSSPPQPPTPDPLRFAITGGASQSLGVALTALTDPSYTRYAWLLSPSYFMVFKIFADANLRMRAVPEGPDAVAHLRAAIAAADADPNDPPAPRPLYKSPERYPKIYRHVIYAVPSFSNPSGATMPLEQREDLVRLARDVDALIVCDDVYDMLQWPSSTSAPLPTHAPLPRLVDIDRHLPPTDPTTTATRYGNVLSNASFSKICAPGIRTGWVEAAPALAHLVSQAGTTKSGGAPSQYAAATLSHALSTGKLQAHIRDVLQPAYARRFRALRDAVQRELGPLGVTIPCAPFPGEVELAGGYFMWLRLPEGVSAVGLAARAKREENVVIAPGRLFMVPEGGGKQGFGGEVRLCFAWEEEGNLVEGVRRLARVVERMLVDVKEGRVVGEEEEAGGGERNALG